MGKADLELAREKLNSDGTNHDFPGRDDKVSQLEDFLRERLRVRPAASKAKELHTNHGHYNKTVYICGVPGTGKTAITTEVIQKLVNELKSRSKCTLKKFSYIYINAQHVASPNKIYSEILYKINKTKATPEKAQDLLDDILTAPYSKDDRQYVVVIDEIDILFKEKRQSIFYSLFDWPTNHASRLILIPIANAMDLSEKMATRIGSRLGWNKIVFEPYTSEHLAAILQARLGKSLMDKCFDKAAIIIATKRIGKTTGDARRILDTCRQAIDEAIQQGLSKVTSALIDRVGFQNLDRMKIEFIQECTQLDLLLLKSILTESAGQGEENIYAYGVYRQLVNLLRNSKNHWLREKVVAYDDLLELLFGLQSAGLIALDHHTCLTEKRLFIRDTSETFRDVVRLAELSI